VQTEVRTYVASVIVETFAVLVGYKKWGPEI